MTTEDTWKKLIEKGKEIQEKAKDKRLPGEMILVDFMRQTGYGKDKSKAILRGLIEAGLIKTRFDGHITYYSPKE